MAKAVKCIIPSLIVIGAISFAVVYLTHHHHQPCKLGECQVKVNEGFVKGRERSTISSGKTFYSFQGIPYAKPPLGPLRFKDPQPVPHWFGVHDCTKEGSACSQSGYGSEDCLFLNIFTTQFPDDGVIPHPVMVYFHGGGFTFGSSAEEHYGADYFMEQDVVLVTVNYRLGIFGFLNLGTDDVPGNAGLKDQVMALKWVKDNIFNFGGNPNNITLFGHSAGAASVHYHTLSPMSTGLFQNVIMQSGSALNQWAYQEDCVERAHLIGRLLGIKATRPDALVQYLRSLPASDLIHVQSRFKTDEDSKRCMKFPFEPCVETPVENSTNVHFLLEHPKTLIESGRFAQVPTIIGIVSYEGSVGLHSSSPLKQKIEGFNEFLPYDLRRRIPDTEKDVLEEKVKEFYYNKTAGIDTVEGYVNICGDLEFAIGVHQTVNYLLEKSNQSVYVYEFTYDGGHPNEIDYSSFGSDFLNNFTIPNGPWHADELRYQFRPAEKKSIEKHSTEKRVINHITKMWTNFAKTKDPNGFHENEYWEETEKEHPRFLDIGELLRMTSGYLLSKRMEFWNEIYLLYR